MSWNDHGGSRRYVHVTETPDVRHITNPDVMHEESDVNVRGVGTFVAILAAGMVLILVLMIGLWKFFEWRAREADERIAVTPMARKPEERLPPPPRLQAAPGFQSLDAHDPRDPKFNFELKEPSAEWDALFEKWNRELASPGAADPATQARRIPIAEAMEMIANQNLPARQTPAGGPAAIPDVPSFSSAGRQTQKREVWARTGTLNTLSKKPAGAETETNH